jgi:hypothetical protein
MQAPPLLAEYAPSLLNQVQPEAIRTVYLKRTTGSFGFTVVEHSDMIGMRIGAVTPGGVADQSAKLFPGDVLLKVFLTCKRVAHTH